MIDLRKQGETLISHLLVRSSGLDPLSARLRLASLLGAAELDHSGLGPSAILFIRRLEDPMAGVLTLGQRIARLPPAWERAVAARIGEFSRRAARPMCEAVAANAEAVLFADYSELLACLAIDSLAGKLASRWWWRIYLHNCEITRAAAIAWLNEPEHAPGAFHHLAQCHAVAAFVRALPDDVVHSLLQKMTLSFGLHELHSILKENIDPDPPDGGRPVIADQLTDAAVSTRMQYQTFAGLPRARGPWRQWVEEESVQSLDVGRECLVGIGLMLHRAPVVVRCAKLARELTAWRRSALLFGGDLAMQALPIGQKSTVAIPSFRIAKSGPALEVKGEGIPPAVPRDFSIELGGDNRKPAWKESPPVATPQAHLPAANVRSKQSETSTVSTSGGELHRLARSSGEEFFATRDVLPNKFERQVAAANDTPTIGLLGKEIQTEFGGIFYLINMGIALNLYGDFTSPARPGISLPIWDFLAVIGHMIVGDRIERDEVWPLLAELGGRHTNKPTGGGFRPSSLWRVPPAWLEPFPEPGTWCWEVADGRLRVRHPARFLALDVPVRRVNILRQLEEELAPYSDVVKFLVRPGRIRKPAPATSRFSRWVSWLSPYIQARLMRGLGVTRRYELPRVLCQHRARVVITSTRIDVGFALDRLPIQVRVCGLDRNPGWVPAAGRFIAFQYK